MILAIDIENVLQLIQRLSSSRDEMERNWKRVRETLIS